ncbi:MAG: TonB-dependent receptor [Bryobacteraceae bacterium]
MIRKPIMTSISFAIVALVVGTEAPGVPAYGQQVPGNVARNSDASTAPTQVQAMFGAIAGVVRNSAKVPISGAMVTVARADGKGIWTTISGGDGIYSIANVAPGEYWVTLQAEGYPDTASKLEITAGRATRTDVTMAGNVAPAPAVISANSSAPGAGAAPARTEPQAAPRDKAKQSVWARVLKPPPAKPQTAPPRTVASLKYPPVAAFGLPAANATTADVGGPFAAPQDAPAPTPAPAAAPAPAPAAAAPAIPDALSSPEAAPAVDSFTPFAFADFTWMNATTRAKDTVLDTKFFTPEIRFDTNYMEDFNQPIDHTIVGATESFRSGEVQIEQESVGGDFHWQNVRGRILFMFGMFATTTPRNDASYGVGQWDLRGAYKYTSEAYGGYHFNVNHGLNVDAGIFVSYIGLFSYYNFDNWTYQPSYVSSNTPWFFNGVRIQWFPTNKLKIEPWFINGWQSYAKYNGHPGLGGQLLWQPKEWFKLVANQYGFGEDNLGLPHTERIHTDDSIEVRYYNKPEKMGLDKMAFTITADAGCQYGGGIQCLGAPSNNKDSFVGWMVYNRLWFHKDLFAVTVGGGDMSNFGRYLTLLPPINGADAVTGSPYFTESPGQKAHMWDSTVTLQYMPREYITWWAEAGYRHSDIPYFAGRGGVTPPGFPIGGTNGAPNQYACMSGAPSGATDLPTATANCASAGGVWFPDLRRSEAKISVGVMVKF